MSEDLLLSWQEMLSAGHRGDSGDGEEHFYWLCVVSRVSSPLCTSISSYVKWE